MTSRARVISSIGIVVLLAAIFNLFPKPSPAEHTADIDPWVSTMLFEGKVVLFSIDRSSALESKESTKFMRDASLKEIGGRYFVTGKAVVPDHPDYSEYDQLRDVSTGIAWERVSEYQAFTEEQYTEYLKIWKNRKED